MKKAIRISIPEPCHEDWNKMTPTEKGKFCAVCTKEVFDFSKSTDEELVKLAHAGNNLCGRFRADQLEREIKLERKAGWSLAPLAASVLLPLSLMANPKPEPKPVESTYLSLGIGSLNKSRVVLTGEVKDVEGLPIPDAKILNVDTGASVSTKADGSYRIVVASGSLIEITKGGFLPTQWVAGQYDQQKEWVLAHMPIDTTVVVTAQRIKKERHVLGGPNIFMVDSTKQTTKDSIKPKKDKTIKVSGVVKDDLNEVAIGVNIKVIGSDANYYTDFEGLYELEVKPEQEVHFEYVGYQTHVTTGAKLKDHPEVILQASELMGDVVIIAGGISARVITAPIDHKPAEYMPGNPDLYYGSKTAVQARKEAYANTKAFEQIKRQRRKEARKKKNQD